MLKVNIYQYSCCCSIVLLKLLKVLRETFQSIQNIESVGNIINIAVPYIITDLINNVKARDPIGSKNHKT